LLLMAFVFLSNKNAEDFPNLALLAVTF